MLAKQGEENIDEFFDKLSRLARKAFKKMGTLESESMLRSRLEAAIRRRTISRLARPYPTDTKEFIKTIKQIEEDEKTDEQISKPKSPPIQEGRMPRQPYYKAESNYRH